MRLLALLSAALMAFLLLGGCAANTEDARERAQPRTRHFELVVTSEMSGTIELYEMNNGNYSRVVAIPFQSPDQEAPAVPGPEIRVTEGDTVVVTIRNENALPHTFHLHGGLVPWEMDGVDYLTQMPILPGEEFTYTFEAMKAGTYWYHCHVDGAHHIDLGMYGAFIVEEREPPVKADREFVILLDEMDNCHVHGNTEPVNPQTSEQSGAFFQKNSCAQRFLQDWLAQNQAGNVVGGTASPYTNSTICPQLVPQAGDPPEVQAAKQQAARALGCAGAHGHGNPPMWQTPKRWWPETMPVYVPSYNTFLMNGKAFPDTPVIAVKQGETLRLRIINAGNQWHAIHPHGHTMDVLYRDGYPLGTASFKADTLTVGPGERYDVFLRLDNPGLWMIHDQNGIATMNDDQHPGGMMTCIAYDGFRGVDAFAMTRALDCNNRAMELFGHEGH
jgi:manganese oxidase